VSLAKLATLPRQDEVDDQEIDKISDIQDNLSTHTRQNDYSHSPNCLPNNIDNNIDNSIENNSSEQVATPKQEVLIL